MDKETIQYNFKAPFEWKEHLERIARLISYERDRSLSYLDIIKEAVEKVIESSGSFLK
jgi:predicted DNA-binding protein